jgi:cellobiose epimerase
MNKKIVEDFSRSVRNQLYDHILPFWTGPAMDNEQGGWMAWLFNDLKPDRIQPRGLTANSRILWTFAAVFHISPNETCKTMAKRAYEIMCHYFWDCEHGGAFWQLTDNWQILNDSKKIYGQAFYIYAMTEFHRALGDNGARDRAIELFELIERHAHDSSNGGYFEVCNRDWSLAENARLSEKDQTEKKSMNNHLHVMEAYANLYRVWKNARVGSRLRELIDLFMRRILDSQNNHLNHFFDEHWHARSDSYTFGHDIEATWLLCEAAEVLGDAALLKQTQDIALKMASAVLHEGLELEGGLCYEGRSGQIIDRGKEWWPQAEAVVGFLNAFQISGDEKFFDAAQKVLGFITEHLVDRIHGDWFWRITPEGRVDTTLPKVSEWKGPYHSSRMCLEALHRLHSISISKFSES